VAFPYLAQPWENLGMTDTTRASYAPARGKRMTGDRVSVHTGVSGEHVPFHTGVSK